MSTSLSFPLLLPRRSFDPSLPARPFIYLSISSTPRNIGGRSGEGGEGGEWEGDGWLCTVAYRVDRGCLLIICYASRRVTRHCYRPRSRLGTEMDTEGNGSFNVEELGIEGIGTLAIDRRKRDFDRQRKGRSGRSLGRQIGIPLYA